MPSTLTGTGASATQSTAPTASVPADGDAENASSVSGPFQTILNHIAKLWAGAFAAIGSNPALQATGSATRAPLNLVPQAAPSAPADGDVWVETGTNQVKARVNGATTRLDNVAVPADLVRAWAKISVGAAGAATVTAGSGVASASWVTSDLTVVFSPALPSANYVAIGMETNNVQIFMTPNGHTTTQVTFTGAKSSASVSFTGGEEVRITVIGG